MRQPSHRFGAPRDVLAAAAVILRRVPTALRLAVLESCPVSLAAHNGRRGDEVPYSGWLGLVVGCACSLGSGR